MANLTTKTKYVNIVVRKNNFNISEKDDKLHEWLNINCELYAYIYHKNDYNLEGLIEHEHVHIVCTLNKPVRLSTTLNSFCSYLDLNTIGVEIDKCNSYEGSLQYLIHKNDKLKTPHEISEIKHNYVQSELETIINSDNDNLTAERLFKIVLESRTNYDIIKSIGLYRYHNLRNVIRDIKEDFINSSSRSRKAISSGRVY